MGPVKKCDASTLRVGLGCQDVHLVSVKDPLGSGSCWRGVALESLDLARRRRRHMVHPSDLRWGLHQPALSAARSRQGCRRRARGRAAGRPRFITGKTKCWWPDFRRLYDQNNSFARLLIPSNSWLADGGYADHLVPIFRQRTSELAKGSQRCKPGEASSKVSLQGSIQASVHRVAYKPAYRVAYKPAYRVAYRFNRSWQTRKSF